MAQPDGSIVISVNMDDSELEKELNEFHKTTQKTMEQFKTAFSNAILPITKLDEAQKRLTENISKSKQEIDSYAESITKSKSAYDEASSKIGEYKNKVDDVGKTVKTLESWMASAKNAVELQKNVITENAKETENLKNKYVEAKNAVESNSEEVKKSKAAYDESNAALKESKAVLKELELSQKLLNGQHKESKTALKESESAYEQQEFVIKSLEREVQNSIRSQEDEIKTLGRLEESLTKTNELIDKNNNSWNVWSKTFSNIENVMKPIGESLQQVGKSLSAYITAPLTALGTLSAKSAIDFESAFAGVKKTVDATEEEFAALEKGIREMAKTLPASAVDISKVAEAAGQLGIEKDNILGFSKVMIDLGESTNLSADEAATSFARFANIVGMSQADFDRLGSVVVDLGNNFATTESEIVAMGMRLAGAGKQIGLTESEIMAFSTALSSVGIEAEMGGSAISKLMVQMKVAAETGQAAQSTLAKTGMTLRELELFADADGIAFKALAQSMGMTSAELKDMMSSAKDLDNFSKVTGMTADEFQRAFGQDAAQTLNKFFSGLGELESKGQSAIVVLDEMGISEVRLRDSILRASNAQDLFSNALEIGQQAWESNTALTEEANKRYETLASRVEITKNGLVDVGITIGEKLMPHIEKGISVVGQFADWFSSLNDSTVKTMLTIGGVAAAVGPVIGTIGSLLSTVGTVSGALSVMSGAMAVSTGAAITATPAMIGLAGGITIVGTAIEVLKGPIGWVTLGIAGVVTAIKLWTNAQEKHREELEKEREALVRSGDVIKELSQNFNDAVNRQKNISELSGKWDELRNSLEKTNISSENRLEIEKELASVEQQLKGVSEGLISDYDLENGLIGERIPLLKEMAEQERKILEIKLQQQIQGKTEKELKNEIAKIDEERAEKQEKYDKITGAYYTRAFQLIENYRDLLLENKDAAEEYLTTLTENDQEIIKTAAGYNTWTGAIRGTSGQLKNLNDQISMQEQQVKELEDDINKLTEQYYAGELSLIEYQNAVTQLKDMKLQDQYSAEAESRSKANDETENATPPVENLATAYESLLTAISDVAKESGNLQKSFQTLQRGEELNADTLLDLIDRYPEVAKHIAETNDLTLESGNILKQLIEEKKKDIEKNYVLELKRLEDEVETSKLRIAQAEFEYKQKAKFIEDYGYLYKSWGSLSLLENERDLIGESIGAETAALEKLQEELANLKSRIAAVNAIELTYTETKKDSVSATSKQTEATKKLTEATEEHIKAVEESLDLIKTEYGTHYDTMTAEQLDFEKESIKTQKEAAEEKEKVHKLALKRMEIESAESNEARLKAQQEYNKLVLDYQNEFVNKQISAREDELKDQQKLQEQLEKDLISSLKTLNTEAAEIEQYHLDKSLEAVRANTDEKITEYNREYDEKIKLIDEASQAEIRALQDKLDALSEEEQSNKSYENSKKLIDLNQAIVKAQMGNGDLAKAMEAYNTEVKRQQDERVAAARKAEKEILEAHIKGIEDANTAKKKLLADQNKAMEEAYEEQKEYNARVLDLEIKIAETKNAELKRLYQEELDEYKRVAEEKAALVKGGTANLQFDKTIEQLEKQFGEAKTDAEKARIQKQLEELNSFRDDFFNNETLLQERLNNLAIEAEKELAFEKERVRAEQHYKEMNETENLEAQARLLMIEGNEEAVISLLSRYNKDWKQQGEEYISNLIKGMDEKTVDLKAYVTAAMRGLVDNVLKTRPSEETGLSEALKKDLSEAEKYKPKYLSLGETLADTFKTGFDRIQTMLAGMMAQTATTVGEGMDSVITVVRGKNDKTIEALNEYAPEWKKSGVTWMDNLVEGMDFQRLINKAKEAMAEMNKLMGGGDAGQSDPNLIPHILNGIEGELYYAPGSDPVFYTGGKAAYEADSARRAKLADSLIINFNKPVESPAEVAREIKNTAKELGNKL